jgi:aspartyl-tRNA synthetase
MQYDVDMRHAKVQMPPEEKPLETPQLVKIHDARSYTGQKVRIHGFVSAIRKQKAVQFIILRDGLDEIQLTNPVQEDPELAAVISSLTAESTIEVSGTVVLDDRIRLNGIEILLDRLTVFTKARELPIAPDSNLDARLDFRFLDLRTKRNQLMMRVQTMFQSRFRQYCLDHEFVEINSPKLMASPSESKSELFALKYFDTTAYLAQSPQFYKQMGIAAGLPGVFETGPVFRANPSFTSRHDTEFTSLDVEFPWISSHEDVMRFEEEMLTSALSAISDQFGEAINETFDAEIVVPTVPFPRVRHADAIKMVNAAGYQIPRSDGDLDPEAERILGRLVADQCGHEFVFVTDYPSSVRPFYHMRYSEDNGLTKSFDLLWKGLEVTTGAQREHRYELLLQQIADKGLAAEPLAHYTSFFKYGVPPHGGFGLGLTRILMILLGVSNVREVTFLYRGPNRLTP